VELGGGDGGVVGFAGEGEAGEGAVGFFDFHCCYGSVGGDGEGEAGDALFLAFGLSGEGKLAVGRGGEAEVYQLFF